MSNMENTRIQLLQVYVHHQRSPPPFLPSRLSSGFWRFLVTEKELELQSGLMEKPVHLLCFLSLCFLSLVAPSHQQQLVQDEDEALNNLARVWGVYLPFPSCFQWDGVEGYLKYSCDDQGCHITYMDLSGASLNGIIPKYISQFSKLQHLNLSRNLLIGTIPESLVRLESLKILDLSFNKLSGPIPESFQNFKSLQLLYLGSNNLTGHLPSNIATATRSLQALDVSFNPIDGILPSSRALLINFLGTSIKMKSNDRKILGLFNCLRNRFCTSQDLSYNSTTFAINCGGKEYTSSSVSYYGDREINGSAFFYMDHERQWGISNIGSDAPGRSITARRPIYGTLDPQLYTTAMMSPKSLRYFVFGLKDGTYRVDLHFAEIEIENLWLQDGYESRLFDVYIQGERMLTDFDILKDAAGSFKALVKSFNATVNTSLIEIHFLQAARWNCFDARKPLYGPLVSAINITRVEGDSESPRNETQSTPSIVDPSHEALRRRGRIAGIALACTAITFVASSVVYLWWIKDNHTGHIRIHADSPKC